MSNSIHGRDALLDKYVSWICDNELRVATSAFLDDYFGTLKRFETSRESATLVAQATNDIMEFGKLMGLAEELDRSRWPVFPSDDEKVYPGLDSIRHALDRIRDVAPSIVVQLRSENNR